MTSAMEVCGDRRKTGRGVICWGAGPGFRRGIAKEFQRTGNSFEQNVPVCDARRGANRFHGTAWRCSAAYISDSGNYVDPRCALFERYTRPPTQAIRDGDAVSTAGSDRSKCRIGRRDRLTTVLWMWQEPVRRKSRIPLLRGVVAEANKLTCLTHEEQHPDAGDDGQVDSTSKPPATSRPPGGG